MLFAVPLVAFLLAFFVFFPSAPWQVTWSSLITFQGNPNKASSFSYMDFIVLDDMEHLLHSDVLGDQVYMHLPEEITSRYSREQIGSMFSTHRHARFVQIWVTGEDPAVLQVVARETEALLPEAVNEYLIPADDANYPSHVETMNDITDPVQLTGERYRNVGAVTVAGGIVAFCLVGGAEWLRVSYRAKYPDR